MYTARTIWIVETLVSLGLMALIGSRLSGDVASSFIEAELVIFLVSFCLALPLGPGKVLTLGVGLAFALATLLAATAGSCSESDFICFGPDAMFALGLIVAGALYPGWAFGAGLGALARLRAA
jgi:hypothetical protein